MIQTPTKFPIAITASVVEAINISHVMIAILAIVMIVGGSHMLSCSVNSMGSANLAVGIVTLVWTIVGPGTVGLFLRDRDLKIFFAHLTRTLIVVVLQIVLGALSFAWVRGEGKAVKELQHLFEDHWKEPENAPDMKPLMVLQTKFECCGLNSAHDWHENNFTVLPHSCYNIEEELSKKGCLRAIREYSDNFFTLTTIDVLILEAFVVYMIFSFYREEEE